MVRRHGGTVNRRAIGWGAAVGTAMVMAAAPAHAEVMDDLFDQLLAPFVDQVTDAALFFGQLVIFWIVIADDIVLSYACLGGVEGHIYKMVRVDALSASSTH